MYLIQISDKAKKELKEIPKKEVVKIFDKIELLSNNPFPNNCKQLKNFGLPNNPFNSNLYRIRVGNYRIIYAVENNQLIVLILKVTHRKDVYK